jgi:hypothetical protein
MRNLAIQALQHKYQAEMADAEFVFQIYLDKPVGIGEHPGLLVLQWRWQMPKKKSQRSLTAWTKQKWRTKSGKPSTQGPKATGERYLPEKAIKALSAKEYAATTRAKRKATKAGKQVSKQPKKIAKKTRAYRKTR